MSFVHDLDFKTRVGKWNFSARPQSYIFNVILGGALIYFGSMIVDPLLGRLMRLIGIVVCSLVIIVTSEALWRSIFEKFRLRNTLEILKTLDASYFITTPSGRLVYAKSLGELDCNKPVAGFINTALFGGESPEKEIFRRGLMELTHGSDTVEKTVSGLKLQGQKVGGLLLWHCREAPETIEDAFPVPVFMLDDKNKVIDMH